MASRASAGGSARERLLAAADELFYAEGVHTVGIDRVIERAGVAKSSLYTTFGSKDELVKAYLNGRQAGMQARVSRHLERYTDPVERLLSVFEAQGEDFAEPGFHGCAFTSAVAESPGTAVTSATNEYRQWVRGLLTGLAREAGADHPDTLARELHMIWDGAHLAARLDNAPDIARAAQGAAATLVDASLAVPAH
jgi:AcrR family transcriptional regulator